MLALDLALFLLALPVLGAAAYLFALAVADVLGGRFAPVRGAPPQRPRLASQSAAEAVTSAPRERDPDAATSAAVDSEPEPRTHFDIVVPAHDEEGGIAETVASLRALDYPPHLFRVLVVADNCSDGTAARAIAAGATVLVRRDPAHRGKGRALAEAFDSLEREAAAADTTLDDPWAPAADDSFTAPLPPAPGDRTTTRDREEHLAAIVVVDADTTVSPGLLRAFARRFEAGAAAVQASYGVRNPEASWRTRLLVIALALFHDVRSRGRERLGLSCGLRGNGMGFARHVLREVPHDAFSIVEDVEYGLSLGEAGRRVEFVPEAQVRGEMVARGDRSRSQRRRWEQGRRALAFRRGPALLLTALRRRDPLLLDLALDLLVPPLATVALAALLGALAATLRAALGGPLWPLAPWAAAALFLAFYVLRGWSRSGAGVRGLVDLLVFAPAYVVWKLALSLGRSDARTGEWVRTPREAHHGS